MQFLKTINDKKKIYTCLGSQEDKETLEVRKK
jgi:hypothetical protein